MVAKSFLVLLLVFSCAFASYEDFSDEDDASCDSSCPDDDAVRDCCKGMGYRTGYCKTYGRAECEGKGPDYWRRFEERVGYRRHHGAHGGRYGSRGEHHGRLQGRHSLPAAEGQPPATAQEQPLPSAEPNKHRRRRLVHHF